MVPLLIARCVVRAVVVAGIGCFLAFVLLELAPGDCATILASGDRGDRELIRRGQRVDSFSGWLIGAARGDLGVSACFKQGEPVAQMLVTAAKQSSILVGAGLLIAMFAGVALGLLWSSQRHRRAASTTRWAADLVSGIPVFLLAFWAIHLLNTGAAYAVEARFVDAPHWFPLPGDRGWLRYLLAAGTLAVGGGALSDCARSVSLEIDRLISSEFMTFSRAAGRAQWKHLAPSLIAPLSALTINRLLALFSGAVIVEMLFGIHGLGYLTWAAALQRDVALLAGACGVWAACFSMMRGFGEIVALVAHPKGAAA